MGGGGETRDLLKSYNSHLTKNFLVDNLDAVCKMLGFDKAEQGSGKSFVERQASECDVVQHGVLDYVQTLSKTVQDSNTDKANKTFASDILTSNCCLSNKLLRLKYANKLEEMSIAGPLMRDWK